MKFRKVIGIILSGAIVLCTPLSGKNVSANGFAPRDTDFHWAEKDINTLVNAGILKGSDGYINPDKSITRGEFCALVARTLGLDGYGGKQLFADIPEGHIFYKEISSLADQGIVGGTGGGVFSPDKTITREEIMLIISRTIDGDYSAGISFNDINNRYTYLKELKEATGSGIISGFADNTFRPYKNATRAESAAMLKRLLNSLDTIDKKAALELAEEYIENDIKRQENNPEITVGRALEETGLKLEANAKIADSGGYVEKLVSGLKLKSYSSRGALASLTYECNIDYVITTTDNSRKSSYKATYTVDIIETNGKMAVYDSTLSLKYPERINLTWEVYSTVPEYAPRGVNIVSPSSFQVSAEDPGVEKKTLMEGISFYNSLTRKYMNYARENGYEVWPIYKTDFTLKTADRFLNDSKARKEAIGYILDYALKYGISGINIDFENIYERNRYLVTRHSRELSVMLHELGLVVSADVTRLEPTSSNWSMCYDRDALANNCDYIMLMAYDEFYASSKSAGPVASMDWVEDSIKKTLGEVPSDKLVLGMPFYMRYFEVTGTKVTSTKAISMQTAYDMIQKNNPTYTYMESDGQYKISWKSGNKTCIFWLENTDTVKKRVELANKYSLAGVASWRRGLEISKVWEVIDENL